MKTGKVWLVGAGPGDAGLLTLKGRGVLERADVVVYDRLVGPGVLAMIPPGARRVDVGKRAGDHPVPQDGINRILLREALAGHRVVRLKGGDPFLFGRGGEELELLTENGVPFEVVPGVTSAVAVPAYAGIPVTHRDCASSVHIITGHTKTAPEAAANYGALSRLGGTLVFLMGVSALPDICAGLLGAGMPEETPAAVLEAGTTARQRRVVSTLGGLPGESARAGIKTPAIIVVGEVCALAERFHWAEDRPLGGVRVVVTRPRELASSLSARLRELGAEVVELPAIRTRPLTSNPALEEALDRLDGYGWLALTSPSGVRILLEALRARRFDLRRLGGIRLAAVGSATARALEQAGLLPELVPETYSAAALGRALAEAAKGQCVLILRAREASPDLTGALDECDVAYDDIPLYETVSNAEEAEPVRALLDAGGIDYLAFTSASTVRGFAASLGEREYSGVTAVCIGAQTAAEAARCGMQTVVAREASIGSMLERIVELRAKRD